MGVPDDKPRVERWQTMILGRDQAKQRAEERRQRKTKIRAGKRAAKTRKKKP